MDAAAPVQTCYRCGVAKGPEDFTQRIDDRRYRMCRSCASEILARRGTKRPKLHHTDTHRTCYLCDRLLPVESFTRRAKGNYFSACKDCNRHVFAQRRRARLLASDGSYTLAEWQELLARHARCPSCLRPWEDIPSLRPTGRPPSRWITSCRSPGAGRTGSRTSSRSASPAIRARVTASADRPEAGPPRAGWHPGSAGEERSGVTATRAPPMHVGKWWEDSRAARSRR